MTLAVVVPFLFALKRFFVDAFSLVLLSLLSFFSFLFLSFSFLIISFFFPQKAVVSHTFRGDVIGCLHVCPVCVRKLRLVCGFDLCSRYVELERMYKTIDLEEQAKWCGEVVARSLDSGPG